MHKYVYKSNLTQMKKYYFNPDLANDLIHHVTKKAASVEFWHWSKLSGVRTTSNGWHREDSLKSQLSARLIVVSH